MAWIALFIFLPAGSPLSQEQSEDTLTIDAYWQLVEDTLEAVQELAGSTPEAANTDLSAWADRWEIVKAVKLSDGTVLPVDTSFLVARLRELAVDSVRLETFLLALQESQQNWADPSHDQSSLVPLEEVLAQPEFLWPEDEPTFIDRIWQQIQERFLRLLARILPSAASGMGPFVQIILTILGVITLAGVLIFTLRGLLADFVSEAEMVDDGEFGDEQLSADQALQRAEHSSSGGDYRSAVRYLYLSSLLLLEERGLIRYDRSQTNQEYLRSVAGRPDLAVILKDVIDVFDRVWYGFQSLDSAAYAQYQARVEQLRTQK